MHQCALGSVGVDPHAVGFIFLPSLVDVGFLGIFCLELFLDRGLDGAFEMSLTGEEGGALRLEIGVNLFGKVAVVSSLLICLKPNGIKRISQFAGEGTGVNASSNSNYCGRMTYPISSLPRLSLASLVSCFAYSSSMFALRSIEDETR